jgi:DNA-binding NarL/FixJ family response regulator
VIILTTYDDDASITAALEAGAASYLTKDASTEDIRRAVHAAVSDHSDPLARRTPPTSHNP